MSSERGYIVIDDAGNITANRQVDPVADITLSGGGGGSLPTWWTVNSTAGSESVDFEGAVEISPDRDVTALTVRANSGQTEHIMAVYNEAGDLCMDIDTDGRMDVISYIVQVPPDTGVDSGLNRTAVNPGQIVLGGDFTDSGVPMIKATRFWTDGAPLFTEVFRVNKSGPVLALASRTGESDVCMELIASEDGTGNAVEMWDFPFNTTLFEVTYAGGIKATLPTNNPGAGYLWNDGGTVKVGT